MLGNCRVGGTCFALRIDAFMRGAVKGLILHIFCGTGFGPFGISMYVFSIRPTQNYTPKERKERGERERERVKNRFQSTFKCQNYVHVFGPWSHQASSMLQCLSTFILCFNNGQKCSKSGSSLCNFNLKPEDNIGVSGVWGPVHQGQSSV